MSDTNVRTIRDITTVLNGLSLFSFVGQTRKESYEFVEKTLRRFRYHKCSKKEKGLVKRYIMVVTGYSNAQVKRLIKAYKKTGQVRMTKYQRHTFARRYSDGDIRLLATLDEAHDFPNGKALKKIIQKEYQVYDKQEYKKLSKISVSHIYNLRQTTTYRRIAKTYNPTQMTAYVSIASREKPYPKGVPGYLRVDTVHQGDKDKEKGLYHLNLVDEVTQFEFVASLPQISQKYMEPMLNNLLQIFPFQIRNFHSDNGSEFINSTVSKLLNRIEVSQTKSRARKTNDNALVESKNGSIIRKHLGYGFMNQQWADAVNEYYQKYYNFYLNFYRPSGFASEKKDKRGKVKKVYKEEDYKTPYEAFKQIEKYEQYVNPDMDIDLLEQTIKRYSPTEFVTMMNEAKSKLFKQIELPDLHIFDLGRFLKTAPSGET